jgi:hypothetical protein
MHTLAFVFVSLICLPFQRAAGADEAKKLELISREELKREFQKKFPIEWSESWFHFDTKARIELIESPVLRQYLPKTRFYFTILSTNFIMCFPRVGTVISVSVSNGKVSLQKCFDLRFTGIDDKFVAMLHGLKAKTPADQKRLALAIGELLAKATEGELKNGRFKKSDYWMDLWSGDGIWRYIVIKFDDKGRLRSVEELNPVELNEPGDDH